MIAEAFGFLEGTRQRLDPIKEKAPGLIGLEEKEIGKHEHLAVPEGRAFVDLPGNPAGGNGGDARIVAQDRHPVGAVVKPLQEWRFAIGFREEEAKAAQQTAVQTFEQGVSGENLPSINMASVEGLSILDAFVQIGFVGSKGEARRLIKQAGLKLNDKVIADENYKLSSADVLNGQVKLSQGKKKHGLIKVA